MQLCEWHSLRFKKKKKKNPQKNKTTTYYGGIMLMGGDSFGAPVPLIMLA